MGAAEVVAHIAQNFSTCLAQLRCDRGDWPSWSISAPVVRLRFARSRNRRILCRRQGTYMVCEIRIPRGTDRFPREPVRERDVEVACVWALGSHDTLVDRYRD